MLVTNTPICPECRQCVMSRDFSALDYMGMILFVLVFFPVTIWIYLTPRCLLCRGCGRRLSERPARSRS